MLPGVVDIQKLEVRRQRCVIGPANNCQASSLTMDPGDDRMNLERNIMDTTQLKRIADALEEILRLVKEDQEKMRKIREQSDEEIEEEARLKDGDDEVSWSK